MNKIKFLARSGVLFAAISSANVNGEYYVIQPGDALSSIASRTISSKSHLALNREQVMLTIFKLNAGAFIEGDINRLIAARRIYIPDNAEEFTQISKSEAQQLLHDQKYLRGLYETASKLKISGAPASTPIDMNGGSMQEYVQIRQTLQNHQQSIDVLKIENEHLSKSFKLLERALGRVVIVQGLLTNDVVKVKSKLFNNASNTSTPTTPPENASTTQQSSAVTDTAPVSLPKIQEGLAKLDTIEIPPATTASATVVDNVSSENNPPASTVDNPKESTAAQSESSKASTNNDTWLDIAMIIAIAFPLLLLLLWILDFRQIRSRLSPSKESGDTSSVQKSSNKDKLAAGSDNDRYAANFAATDGMGDDLEPIRIKADKSSAKDHGLVERVTELGGVLELLDMCLLCGDYQQAHSVTLKAISDYQSSPVLAKKLTFIERKLAKY